MYVIILISAFVVFLLWLAVRGRATHVQDVTAAEKAIVPVDLEAFRNLIDPQQERYLREHLSRGDFHRVQRARYLAIAEYLWCVAGNASVIVRLGEAARAAHEPSMETQGAELTAAAVSVRLYSILALAQAYAGILVPGLGISVGSVADSYDRLTAKVWAIGRVWTPVRTAS